MIAYQRLSQAPRSEKGSAKNAGRYPRGTRESWTAARLAKTRSREPSHQAMIRRRPTTASASAGERGLLNQAPSDVIEGAVCSAVIYQSGSEACKGGNGGRRPSERRT